MRIAIEADDFSPLNHRFDLLNKLYERYPDFKITLFTTPWEIRFSPHTRGTPITEPKYQPWIDEVKGAIDAGWMRIGIHGLTHAPKEFDVLTYSEAQKRVLVAQKMFENVNIPVTKLFKAPYWLLSKGGKQAIQDMGLTVVEDGSYTWNIQDEMPDAELIIAHGHIQDARDCPNGLDQSFHRLIKIPTSAEWVWLEDVYGH